MNTTSQSPKRYYSIGEVSKMTGLEPYVLRYWEKEFTMLRPKKSRGGSRQYTSHDIEIINRINLLRHQEKLTIDGARAKMNRQTGQTELSAQAKIKTTLGQIRSELEALSKLFP